MLCVLNKGCAVRQVNGSSIRPWWIHHHYWAAVTMALLLTLPVDSSAVQAFVRKFLWWSTFQARPMAPKEHLESGSFLALLLRCV
jgi:hypothetical protein